MAENGVITSIGSNVIWFAYKGDEICWNGNKYISLLSEGEFDTLDEMDLFWRGFFAEGAPGLCL